MALAIALVLWPIYNGWVHFPLDECCYQEEQAV